MEDYVIIRQSDKTGEQEVYGPYEETEARQVIKARKDRSMYSYWCTVLIHPMELRELA
jgi:hypothetical protein